MRDSSFKIVICKSCNWCHMGVSRRYAVKSVKDFNEYFQTLSKKQQKENYGGKGADLNQYEKCFRCGGSHKNFRTAKKKEIPNGSTIQPVIWERMK